MRIGTVLLLVATCAWAGGCAAGKGKGASSGSGSNHPLLRQVAPESEVKLQTGPSWKPANASGKVLVIDFWATWCVPCKDSFPKLDAIYKKHGGHGLEVIGVNEDEDPKGISSFLQQTGATFPIALDPEGNMATTYNVGTMPSEFVLDRKGVVRYVHSGYHPEEMDDLDDEIAELLREPP